MPMRKTFCPAHGFANASLGTAGSTGFVTALSHPAASSIASIAAAVSPAPRQ
jgi:hypothetical protein